MRIRDEIADLEKQLRVIGSPERAMNEKRYLKSDLDFLGVGAPAIRTVVKAWLKTRPSLEREDLTRLVRVVGARIDRISGVTIREAVKYLPPADRAGLLDRYRAR